MRSLDFFFALRPLVLLPAWSFFLIGHGAAGADLPLPWQRLILFTLVMTGVHLVNQVCDFESDRINDKGLFLQGGVFGRRTYSVAALLAIGFGLAGACIWRQAPGLVAFATALGLAYSVPPLRLAARPGWDVAANAAGYGGIAPLLGAGVTGWRLEGATLLVASTMLAVAAVFLHTTLLDLEGDRRTGKRTSGVALGVVPARAIAAGLAAGAAACAALGAGWPLRLAASTLALLACLGVFLPGRVSSRTLCVGATAVYAVAAGFAWPPFLPGVVALVAVTRVYYARRFGRRYPAL